MRQATKSNRDDYYKHILSCADDTLVVSKNAKRVLKKEIEKCFDLRPELVEPPKLHLGALSRKVLLENGVET